MVNSRNKRFINKALFLGFLLIYAAALGFICNELNVSIDEASSLNTTSKSLSYAINQSIAFEGQPPLYFILLTAWRHINSSIFFARLFSVLSILLATIVFYKLVKLVSDKSNPKWMAVLFLVNPFTTFAATDIRLYALIILLSMCSIYFFFLFYTKDKIKYLFIFSAIGIIGLLTQYLYVFLIASLGFALLLYKGWKFFFQFCLFALPALLLFLYNIFFKANPLDLALINSLGTTIPQRIINVFHSPQNLIFSLSLVPLDRKIRWGILLVSAVLFGYTYFKWYKKNNSTLNKIYFNNFNIIMVSGCTLLILISILFAYTGLDYYDRYAAIVFPFFLSVFIIFYCYSSKAQTIIFITVATFYVTLLIYNYRYGVKEYDQKSLAKYITAIQKKDEPVLFYQKILSLPFSYYYKGGNTIVQLPDSLKFDSTYFSKVKDTLELKQSLSNINSSSQSYLIVTDRVQPWFQDNADIKMMTEYFDIHFTTTLDTLYYGNSKSSCLRIRRFQKKRLFPK
jgi:uncharacterized membrane protein